MLVATRWSHHAGKRHHILHRRLLPFSGCRGHLVVFAGCGGDVHHFHLLNLIPDDTSNLKQVGEKIKDSSPIARVGTSASALALAP